MPVQVIPIVADTIDAAAEEIIRFLEHPRQESVIYLDGWFGLGIGAHAVLKAVVEQYRSSWSGVGPTRKAAAGLDKIIHIDCSLWQSKRPLQKAIAEELKLPQEMMALFDLGDEEDDFDGVSQANRGVIPQVKGAILNELSNCKFLVVFHNGSGNYVDLWECGVPVIGAMSKRVLWTSQSRFLVHDMQEDIMKKLAGLSDVAITVAPQDGLDDENYVNDIFSRVLHAEAEEVARYIGVPESKIVLECVLYKLLTRDVDSDIDWGTHATNYWVCDGIIPDTNNGRGRLAWEIGDALHRTMNLDWSQDAAEATCEVLRDAQSWDSDRWVSGTGQGAVAVQVATSFFWTAAIIEGGMFKHLDRSKLRVIHLSHCTFSFSSPPFLRCCNLRFLLLDHCEDNNNAPADHGEEQDSSQGGDGTCFQKLWVLELSHTDWYWLLSKKALDLMAELKELHVKGPGNWSLSHLHSSSSAGSRNGSRLLKLRVVGGPKDSDNVSDIGGHINQPASTFPNLSSWNVLKTVILDGCVELQEIDCNTLPPSLESFSFTSYVPTKIKSISFRGCSILKSLLLRGVFGELVELDMSTTSVKTLDLSEMQALCLRRLFLLGCQKLRAVLWPQETGNEGLEVLRIDTTNATWAMEDMSRKQESASDVTSAEPPSAAVHCNGQALTNSDSYISLRDARLFRSLLRTELRKRLQVEVSSTDGHKGAGQRINNNEQEVRAVSLQNAAGNLYVDDIISAFQDDNSQTACTNGGDVLHAPAIMWMWDCPFIPMDSDSAYCYIRIQHETPTESLQVKTGTKQETSATLPGFVQANAMTLHLHDCLCITSIPGPAAADIIYLDWNYLRWCRLERCPNIEGSVFITDPFLVETRVIFVDLETFWASQILKARYIWDWNKSFFHPGDDSFSNFVFLHLDHCPRLVHVLPLHASNGRGCHRLETLEIVCCGELREVFPSDSESLQKKPREFPSLRRIHLYELPKLQRICGQRMLAPRLETVKIRGCWSLKRLPAVPHAVRLRPTFWRPVRRLPAVPHVVRRLPYVDCEKELWDSLEWDGKEADHHPSLYKTTNSVYYKKTLLRTTVLR